MGKDIKSLLYRFVFTITAPEDTEQSVMVGMLPELESVIGLVLEAKKYSFQLELGKEAGRLHFQGRFSLPKKKSIKNVLDLITKTGVHRGWQLHIDRERSDESTSTLYTKKSETSIPGTFISSEKLYAASYRPDDLFLENDPSGQFRWQHQLEAHLNAPFWDVRGRDDYD